ncbi:MAG: serine/threonine protein kinase [Bacteriovorax sp.]|nr:serine/threonine protein kinase [Bacteriovorax sp.]
MDIEKKLFVSGIHGFDQILGGGFLKGRLYLVEGIPGSGKTILGNQLVFANAEQGHSSLFVTLLSESHGKMLENLRGFEFYNENIINDKIFYLSGYSELSESGIDGFKKFLTQNIRSLKIKLVVIDGFKIVSSFSKDNLEYSTFLHDLNTLASALDCIFVILNPLDTKLLQSEDVLTDGLIELKRTDVGMRNVREIHVHKMRGMKHFEGRHELSISRNGIRVFPRIELLVAKLKPFLPNLTEEKKSFGIKNLDEMLKGGILAGSVTSLFGPPGSGKTLIGLKFLHEGLLAGENSLYFGFYETRDQMLSKANGIGLNFEPFINSGQLQFEWYPPTEQLIDELFEKLVNVIEEKKISRVFIDGIEGFKFSAVFIDRLPRFVASLTIKLRSMGVTAFFSEEARMPSMVKDYHLGEYSAAFENIIYLRYMESDFHVRRLINIYKVRASSYDISIHEFHIQNQGIVVEEKSYKQDATP